MASEEDEKELELKDLIIQTLEANGILPKLKVLVHSVIKSIVLFYVYLGTNTRKCFHSY